MQRVIDAASFGICLVLELCAACAAQWVIAVWICIMQNDNRQSSIVLLSVGGRQVWSRGRETGLPSLKNLQAMHCTIMTDVTVSTLPLLDLAEVACGVQGSSQAWTGA